MPFAVLVAVVTGVLLTIEIPGEPGLLNPVLPAILGAVFVLAGDLVAPKMHIAVPFMLAGLHTAAALCAVHYLADSLTFDEAGSLPDSAATLAVVGAIVTAAGITLFRRKK